MNFIKFVKHIREKDEYRGLIIYFKEIFRKNDGTKICPFCSGIGTSLLYDVKGRWRGDTIIKEYRVERYPYRGSHEYFRVCVKCKGAGRISWIDQLFEGNIQKR